VLALHTPQSRVQKDAYFDPSLISYYYIIEVIDEMLWVYVHVYLLVFISSQQTWFISIYISYDEIACRLHIRM